MASYVFHISVLGRLIVSFCAASTAPFPAEITAAGELAGNLLSIIDQVPRISRSSVSLKASGVNSSFYTSSSSSATTSALSYTISPTLSAIHVPNFSAQTSLTNSTATNIARPANTAASLSSLLSPFRTEVAANSISSSTRPTTLMPVAAVITSINPTGTAALADGVVLGAALLSFSKSAAQIGPDIVKAQTKTASLKALRTIEADLEDAFKDRGGIDTGSPCLTGEQRLRFRRRSLLDTILNAFRCAIRSVSTLIGHLSEQTPDPTVIEDGLVDLGKWAEELEKDEESEDETRTQSDSNDKATSTPEQKSRYSQPSTIATRTSATPSWRSSQS